MPSKYFSSTDTTLELADTMRLQKASLDVFASELGYRWCTMIGGYWRAGLPTAMRDVKLSTMQRWHNSNLRNFINYGGLWHHGEPLNLSISVKLGVTYDCLQKAIDAKLVKFTHLQYSKKSRKLLCTNHQIKFA